MPQDQFKFFTNRKYAAMRARFGPKYNLANELVKPGREIPFSLNQFREWVNAQLRVGMKCTYCGKSLTVEKMEPDHIVPVKRGGDLGLHNLAACCHSDNVTKGELTGDEYRAFIAGLNTFPEAAKKYILKCMRTKRHGFRGFAPQPSGKPQAKRKPKPAALAVPSNLFEEPF